MRIAVRTFAAYRQAVGSSTLTLELPEGITPRGVWSALADRYPALRRFPPPSAFAVNDEFIDADRPLTERDELALIPPVSGGGVSVALTREPVDLPALLAAVSDPAAGAVTLFCGTVRAHSRERSVQFLEYEAYEVLAEREMRRIADEAASRWPAQGIAVVHRLGHLEIGEISVAIAVATPHRADAFAAARYIIDTLKQTVPIWKKEVWGEGEEWIGSGA